MWWFKRRWMTVAVIPLAPTPDARLVHVRVTSRRLVVLSHIDNLPPVLSDPYLYFRYHANFKVAFTGSSRYLTGVLGELFWYVAVASSRLEA